MLKEKKYDRVLMIALLVFNMGSATTTMLGVRELLPNVLAQSFGISIQLTLFIMLAGLAMRNHHFSRWIIVVVCAAFSIYTSYWYYFGMLASEKASLDAMAKAEETHGRLVSVLYTPNRQQYDRYLLEAETNWELSRKERESGITTGIPNKFGPAAEKFAQTAVAADENAARMAADVKLVGDIIGKRAETPQELYEHDMLAWQSAPGSWRADVPQPRRSDYIDAAMEVGFFTPIYMLMRWDINALGALLLAFLVDGISILIGTKIRAGRKSTVQTMANKAAESIKEWKDAISTIRSARKYNGLPRRSTAGFDVEALKIPIEIVVADDPTKGAQFLIRFYGAINPKNKTFDFKGCMERQNSTIRMATRMLFDMMCSKRCGWMKYDKSVTLPSYGGSAERLSDLRDGLTVS